MRTVAVAVIAMVAGIGCGDSNRPIVGGDGGVRVCDPGATRPCTCTDGNTGAQSCAADGESYEACACVGTDSGNGIDAGGDIEIDAGGSGGRDAGTMRVDAGPSGCTVHDNGDMTISDTCGGDTICICPGGGFCEGSGSCMSAFGRTYALAIASAALPDFRPDGMCWDDPGCGPPDPFVEVLLDGVHVGQTPTANDVFSAGWGPPYLIEVTFFAGDSMRYDVYDEDIAISDGAFSCTFAPVTASLLRTRNASCIGAAGVVLAAIAPE